MKINAEKILCHCINSSQDENPAEKNPHREKFLWGKIPARKYLCRDFPHWENQNVIIYLKNTEMCQTNCNSEPKLDFRSLNRFFKKFPRQFFLQKSLRRKSPRGKWYIVITGWHSFLHTTYMSTWHIWIKRWTLEFTKIHSVKFFARGKIPAGIVKNNHREIFSPGGFWPLVWKIF